jgi:hypothetical protein
MSRRLTLGELADLLVMIHDRREKDGAVETEVYDDELPPPPPPIRPAAPAPRQATKPPEAWTVEEKRRVVAEATQLIGTPFMSVALREGLPFWQLEAWCREFGGPKEAGRSRGSEKATAVRGRRKPR